MLAMARACEKMRNMIATALGIIKTHGKEWKKSEKFMSMFGKEKWMRDFLVPCLVG